MAYPSTFADLQTAVIGKLRLDSAADLSRVKDTLNQVYAQVCVQTEANQTSATATLIANVSSYAVPTEILRIKQITVKPTGQSDYGSPLRETGLEQILGWRQGNASSTGAVTHYALVGMNQMELWPTPASADTLLFFYVALPTKLNLDADVPILQEPYGSKILEYGALAELGDFLLGADSPATREYRGLYDQWLQRFRAHLNRRAGGKTLQFKVAGMWPWVPHDPSADVRTY